MKYMNNIMKAFIEYATFNDDGDLTGIIADAPKEAKEAYKQYKELIDRANSDGYKI